MITNKTIALIAHDGKKEDLAQYVFHNKTILAKQRIVATGTTGSLLESILGTEIEKKMSGPLGGDAQIGAMIVEGAIDYCIFFPDPLDSVPHDSDVNALIRLCCVWNIPFALNRATADHLISSALLADKSYERQIPDYTKHNSRMGSVQFVITQDNNLIIKR
jgi:methylglyoxal synthase